MPEPAGLEFLILLRCADRHQPGDLLGVQIGHNNGARIGKTVRNQFRQRREACLGIRPPPPVGTELRIQPGPAFALDLLLQAHKARLHNLARPVADAIRQLGRGADHLQRLGDAFVIGSFRPRAQQFEPGLGEREGESGGDHLSSCQTQSTASCT